MTDRTARSRSAAVLALACLGSPALAQAPETTPGDPVALLGESPIAKLLDLLGPDVALFDMHVVTLSNPFFEGRGATTRGSELAAEYIRFYFEKLGLTPAFPETTTAADGTEVITPRASFSQPFDPNEVQGRRGPKPVKVLGSDAAIRVGEGGWAELIPDVDYSVLGCSGTAEVEGELVFVGYSITSGPEGYLGYPPAADLTGKIAVAFRYEPLNEEGSSRWSEDGSWSMAATLEPKISAAVRRGAKAVIVVTPPGVKDEDAQKLATASETAHGEFDVPVIMLSQERAEFLLAKADPEGRSLVELRQTVDAAPAIIQMPGATIRVRTEVDRTPALTWNVGGLLEGRGELADEIIIVGAHFDHAGYGQYGGREQDVIHPGADDNASGTSAMLLAAERLSEAYAGLPADAEARSILFMGFSAEEWGLLGSKYYAEHPIAPIGDHVFMINMDMVGRVTDNALMVGGETTAEALGDWLEPFKQEAAFDFRPLPPGVFGRSDHASFFRAGVPCLFFFSGFHEQYHAPEDTSALINRVGAVRVSTMAQKIALALATREERPVFVDDDGRGPRTDQPPTTRPQGSRVRFGVQPAGYGADGGVAIENVFPGTSAAEAGLQPGDVMTGWNGTKLTSVDDWMPLLGEAKPGDKVTITYTRNGEEHTTTATLKAAGG
ncbi:MAG TPA: M28 family peptidase [Phycisphaerales bacterium]|nr:M28 family peptidase [Phycisphaerales bacterium]